MPGAAHLVENHATDINVRIKIQITPDERGDTPGHTTCIDHQYHWRGQHGCKRGVAICPFDIDTIKQPFVALYQADICITHVTGEGGGDFLACLGKEIQVVTGFPGGTCQPQGINIIRAFFKGLYCQAPLYQRGGQTNGDGSLA